MVQIQILSFLPDCGDQAIFLCWMNNSKFPISLALCVVPNANGNWKRGFLAVGNKDDFYSP